ncbi:hypothetical protein HDK64DRAFT_106348 [Phyllosticta capitalensis]
MHDCEKNRPNNDRLTVKDVEKSSNEEKVRRISPLLVTYLPTPSPYPPSCHPPFLFNLWAGVPDPLHYSPLQASTSPQTKFRSLNLLESIIGTSFPLAPSISLSTTAGDGARPTVCTIPKLFFYKSHSSKHLLTTYAWHCAAKETTQCQTYLFSPTGRMWGEVAKGGNPTEVGRDRLTACVVRLLYDPSLHRSASTRYGKQYMVHLPPGHGSTRCAITTRGNQQHHYSSSDIQPAKELAVCWMIP